MSDFTATVWGVIDLGNAQITEVSLINFAAMEAYAKNCIADSHNWGQQQWVRPLI